MIGFWNVSVILTYLSLVAAVVGIRIAMNGNHIMAVVCLMIAGFCDMFDGRIARAIKRTEDEKVFGIQIDSLNDLVCFGVLPAVIAYSFGVDGVLGMMVCAFYVLAALIRLAYFNVTEQKRQQETDENRRYYQGLPVTTIAGLFPVLCMFKNVISSGFPGVIGDVFPIFLGIALTIIGLLFILNIKVPKPHGKIFYVLAVILAIYMLVFLFLAVTGRLVL